MTEVEPHWATSIRAWIMLVNNIRETQWEKQASWGEQLDFLLENSPPHKLYDFYEDFMVMIKADAARR
jgi:hypothetical protein